MNNLKEYKKLIKQWSTDRKIYKNSTAEAQYLKTAEELGELAEAINNNDINEIKDAIGDIFVCVTNVDNMDKAERLLFNQLAVSIFSNQFDVNDIEFNLEVIANKYGLTLNDCVEQAWNEIKDRKGYINEQGVFVKEVNDD